MILLKVRANWKTSVKEKLKFETAIFESQNRREVRESIRVKPKWTFEFDAMVRPEHMRKLISIMTWARESRVVLACPTLGVQVANTPGGVNDYFECEVPWWIKVGTLVTARNSIWQVRSIAGNGFYADPYSVSGEDESFNLITEDGDFNLTTEDGDFNIVISDVLSDKLQVFETVRLAIPGRLEPKMSMRLSTRTVGTVALEFTAEPEESLVYDQYVGTEFGELDIFDFRQNWRESTSLTLDSFRETFESKSGPWAHFWRSVYSSRSWNATYSQMDADSSHRMLSFFNRQRGRCNSFNFPAPSGEIEVVSASGFFIVVKGADATMHFSRDDTARVIYLRAVDGTVVRREVIQQLVDDDLNTIRLRVDPALPVDMKPVYISGGLFQSRFASDELTLEWLTDEVSETDFAVRSIDYVEQVPEP